MNDCHIVHAAVERSDRIRSLGVKVTVRVIRVIELGYPQCSRILTHSSSCRESERNVDRFYRATLY